MRVGGGLVLVLLTGCVVPPTVAHPKLEMELPSQWAADRGPQGKVSANWWQAFGDPRLETLVKEAVAKNYNLQAAAAQIASAEAQAVLAGAGRVPQVGAGLNARRQRQNFIGFPGVPGIVSTTSTTYGVSLDVSWEIDLWGRLAAGERAALADLQASRADFAGARLSLIAQTAKTFFATIEAQRQVELARSTAESNRVTTGRIRDRYERGLRPALDLRLSEANLANSDAFVHVWANRLDAVLRQLETLLGRYPSADIKVPTKLPDTPEPVPVGLPSELLTRRPDLVAAERRLAAADSRITEARGAFYPSFSLTGSGGTSSDTLSDLVDKDFRVWNMVASILAPLFQGGRLQAGLDLARAGADQSLAVYADGLLRAFSEVETTLASEGRLAQRETALKKAVGESQTAYDISERRYTGGLIDIVTLLDTQRRLFNAQSQLISVRRARLDARINLHLALGGGFEE